MISIVVATHNDGVALAETLGSLVPAALDGLVKDVVVGDAGSSDATSSIADGFGADVVEVSGTTAQRLNAAAGASRGSWLMFVPPGATLQAGFEHEVALFLERPTSVAARFRPAGLGPLADATMRWWRNARGVVSNADVLLIRRSAFIRLNGFGEGRNSDLALVRLKGTLIDSLPVLARGSLRERVARGKNAAAAARFGATRIAGTPHN